jgi:hypothetical protein
VATRPATTGVPKVLLNGSNFIVTNGRGNGFAAKVDTDDSVSFTIGEVFLYYDYFVASLHDIVERVNETILTAGIVSVHVASQCAQAERCCVACRRRQRSATYSRN